MNSFKRVRTFQIELEFGSVGFLGEGKSGVPGEKPLGARERTNNKREHFRQCLGEYHLPRISLQEDMRLYQ